MSPSYIPICVFIDQIEGPTEPVVGRLHSPIVPTSAPFPFTGPVPNPQHSRGGPVNPCKTVSPPAVTWRPVWMDTKTIGYKVKDWKRCRGNPR